MRYQRCSVLLSATIFALGNSPYYENVEGKEEFDARDFEIDDVLSEPLPLEELAKLELEARSMAEEKGAADEQFKVDDDDEAEGKQEAGGGTSGVELDMIEELDDDELERAVDEEQGETIEEKPVNSSSGASLNGLHGGMVQIQDEEGTKLDTSALSHVGDGETPTISKFVDATPKFKKEEEDKQRRKDEAKERKRNNNDIYEYEAEIRTFLEAQEKNKARFKDGIENAEVDMQAPKKPSLWQRLKHWYNMVMNELNEKYASENVE